MPPTMQVRSNGSVGGVVGRIMNQQRQPYCVRSIALAMWLQAKGFDILGTEPSRDGRGIVFLFPSEAGDETAGYFAAKDTINRLLMDSQQK